jgi:alginate O-acetyltransferase complex protein AlgF
MNKVLLYTRMFSMLFLVSAEPAVANDQELYDPAPPSDAAFVRVLNGGSSGDVTPTVGDAKYGKVAAPGISAYRVVKQGAQRMKAGEKTESIQVEAGKYYTLALSAEGNVTMLSDAIIEQPSKAYVYFYNFSDAPKASLRATKQNVDVVGDVVANTGNHREMNALTVDLAVVADGKTIKDFPGVVLKRRSGVSFLLTGTGDAKQAAMIENNIQR